SPKPKPKPAKRKKDEDPAEPEIDAPEPVDDSGSGQGDQEPEPSGADDASASSSPERIERPAGLEDLAKGMQENREGLEAAQNVLNTFREGAEFVLESVIAGGVLR